MYYTVVCLAIKYKHTDFTLSPYILTAYQFPLNENFFDVQFIAGTLHMLTLYLSVIKMSWCSSDVRQ